MDTDLLVEQRAGGQRLIEQLVRDEFPVSAAFWVRTSEGNSWRLEIAYAAVDEEDSNDAYRRLYASIDKTRCNWVTLVDVRLLNERDPIVRAVIELRDWFPDPLPAYYQGRRLGTLAIKEAYIYPEIAAPRRSYMVAYSRTGKTNHWTATIKRGRLFRKLKAKGAISYSTARCEGENGADPKCAMVGVLVAVDPRFDRPEILVQPELKKMMADQARSMADEMFKSRHPDAIIEPELDQEESVGSPSHPFGESRSALSSSGG
jgi:hypothetical protein